MSTLKKILSVALQLIVPPSVRLLPPVLKQLAGQ